MANSTIPTKPAHDAVNQGANQAKNLADQAKNAAHSVVDQAAQTAQHVQNAAGQAVNQAKDAAGHVIDQAKNVAGQAYGQAKDAVSGVAGQAREYAGQAYEKADEAVGATGSTLKGFAGRIRSNVPQEGTLGSAGRYVADGVEQAGSYLEQHDIEGMAGDVTDAIKRNPVAAVLIGVGVGFLLARAITPRSE